MHGSGQGRSSAGPQNGLPWLAWIALVAVLAFGPVETRADASQAQNGGPVVISNGLCGTVLDGKLRRAELVFNDTALTVAVKGEAPGCFRYETLRLRKGTHHPAPPLLNREFSWGILAQLPAQLATGGIGSGAVCLGTALGVGHFLHLWTNRHGKRSLTRLRSTDDYRSASRFLASESWLHTSSWRHSMAERSACPNKLAASSCSIYGRPSAVPVARICPI